MFAGFTSLTTAPELPAKTLEIQCYSKMFKGCTSLTLAPKLPATTLASGCYLAMFNGCTSLETAPELPATTLVYSCYNDMFDGCTSLTDIPALDVAAVTNLCCRCMFQNCSNLVVNTTGPGKEWKISADVKNIDPKAQFSGNQYWATDMFANTAGDVGAGAEIVPGKTYYFGAKKEVVGDATLYRYGDQIGVSVKGELTKAIADTLKDQGITNLTIGAGVTDIGEGAFSYWVGLKDVTIGDSVTNIADSAFFRCAYVTNLVVGAGVENVGDNAFNRCFSLESFTFGSLAAAEACQDAYKVVTRITMDGKTPVVDTVPDVKVEGYTKTLKGKKYLTDEEWTAIADPSQIPSDLHFFKYEYKAEEH